jgi:UDP-N-acetylglucosamine pyrophosphorylase
MQIIILAAGKGSRMKSELPKVMHKVGGKPMLEHVIDNCRKISDDLILVYSDHIEEFLPLFEEKCSFVKQEKQLGTAHAVAVAKHKFDPKQPIGVIYGDNPLITAQIIQNLFDHMQDTNSQAVTLAFEFDKPNAYGRIVVDSNGDFQKIVESKFANSEEQKITLCNSGIMSFAPGVLGKYIEECMVKDTNNPEKELYLTEIIEICSKHEEKVSYYISNDHKLVLGVNTQEELQNTNSLINKK